MFLTICYSVAISIIIRACPKLGLKIRYIESPIALYATHSHPEKNYKQNVDGR